MQQVDGFGGLVASGTQVCGFKPGRSRWIFTGVKILSLPSSGEEVKESVPFPSFAAYKNLVIYINYGLLAKFQV